MAAAPVKLNRLGEENEDILHFCRCVVWTQAFGPSAGHGNNNNLEYPRFVSHEDIQRVPAPGPRPRSCEGRILLAGSISRPDMDAR